MTLRLPGPPVRPWEATDAESLVRHANSLAVWRNVRDRFPHPYTDADAKQWLDSQESAEPPVLNFAIAVGEEAVGGVGLIPGTDVEAQSAEIGYWLGEQWWGRGLATAAVREITWYGFGELRMIRLFASVFDFNPASGRVLEKVGYVREGVLRDAAVKQGQVVSTIVYGMTRDDYARAFRDASKA